MNDQRALITYGDHQQEEQEDDEQNIRDIHALTPPHPPPPAANNRVGRRREAWETSSPRLSSLSITSTADLGSASSNENFTTMSREFSALVMAGSAVGTGAGGDHAENNLAMIGEHEAPTPEEEETNPLAIVTDNNPLNETYPSSGSHATRMSTTSSSLTSINSQGEVSMHRVKKEEVESKISAWQNAKIAKINNRFKREDAVINGWEGEQVQKSTSWMKKVERKLEEKRARALEKMQNEVAKAHRKAEEKRASAEAKRGTKVSRVLDIANLMRAVGRPPVKRSFF